MSAANMELDFLVQQPGFIVLNKPGGLLTQAPPGIDSLEHRVKLWRRQNSAEAEATYLGLPHRLDRPVSGAILMGLDSKSTKFLSRQFEHRTVEKTYWALVEGTVVPAHGTWDDYLLKIDGAAKSEVCDSSHSDGQFARLRYRTLVILESSTLIEIELETGRTHQIRIQSGSRSHPLIGDELYGSETPFGPSTEDSRKRWIALHARKLTFLSPTNEHRLEVIAPLPAHWSEVKGLEGIA